MGLDYYQILEIGEQASEDEIKKAYRKLSKKYHPDANPDNEEAAQKFYEISKAYETLSDGDRRKAYDLSKKQADADPARKKRASGKQTSQASAEFDMGNLNGTFENFFGFHPKTGKVNEDKLDKNKKTKANPMDMTEMFERYMGMKK